MPGANYPQLRGGDCDFYEIPAQDFYAARDGRKAKGRMQVDEYFDFNDRQQPNPWQSAPVQQPLPSRPREREPASDASVDFEVKIAASPPPSPSSRPPYCAMY